MEPRALANVNGTIVSSPIKATSLPLSAPTTPLNRRNSSLWVRTPLEAEAAPSVSAATATDDCDAGDVSQSWGAGFLTPVPATPAPEAIARYAAALAPATPSPGSEGHDAVGDDDSSTPRSLARQPRGVVTCPPKPKASGLEGGLFGRVLAARRKSMQFAPKVGSPLAREVQ